MSEWLTWLAFGLATVSLGAHAAGLRGADLGRWPIRLRRFAAIAAAIVFLRLLVAFVSLELDIQYVYLYTGEHVPLRYRIAGTWAGREGSLVLWAMYAAIVASAARVRPAARLLLLTASVAFTGAVVAQSTFAVTPEFLLQSRPGGNGLNPTLWSPFILIHPPIMFLAYALTAVPAASSLAHLWTGSNDWSHVEGATRVNWILYTFAMGLGGIWAYYTLGFGGYWAWDPVEVANLLPWLALTLYLHAQAHHAKYGRYTAIGPLLGILPFLLTIFSTVSTRSGLWVSVHAFTDPTDTFNPDAAARFLDIMAVEAGLGFYVGAFLVTTAVFLALWARRLALDIGKATVAARILVPILVGYAVLALLAPASALSLFFAAGDLLGPPGIGMLILLLGITLAAALPLFFAPEQERKLKLDVPLFGYLAITILGASLLLFFLFHMAAANGWSESFYLLRLPLLATPAIAGMTLFQSRFLGRRNSLIAVAIGLAAGGIGALLAGKGGYLIGMAGVLLVAALWRTQHTLQVKASVQTKVGGILLALGALANVLFWLNPPTTILFGLQPRFPIQVMLGAASFYGLHRSLGTMAGRPIGATAAWVGLLGGFFVAPVLAIAAWFLVRPETAKPRRLSPAGVHLIHAAVALALLGYATTSYFGWEEEVTLRTGESATLAGTLVELQDLETSGSPMQEIHPVVAVGEYTGEGTLYWEDQTGSYFPLPGTIRAWDQDIYITVEGVCRDDCSVWIRAFEPNAQLPDGANLDGAQLVVSSLPGLGLVWGALMMFIYGMLLVAPSTNLIGAREDS